MKIAIVGSGISGLVCAYLLNNDHDVTLFEANDYLGGHTHTVRVYEGERALDIDTGFIVFNEWTYPNFIRLLEKLNVASKPSCMGFSVRCEKSGVEYSGNSLSGIYAQRANLFRPEHQRMVWDILRFFRQAKKFLEAPDESISLGEYVRRERLSAVFTERFLVPMTSAIWSAEPATVREFPAAHFLRFFKNHGLLNVLHRPVWQVVEGGSSRYVEKISEALVGRIRLNSPVQKIVRNEQGVSLHLQGSQREDFDAVIIATHSDQALRMLGDPTETERDVLSAIAYQDNETVLHTDETLLPKSRRAWASWNYRLPMNDPGRAALTYNMNILQGLDSDQTYCVTLNDSAAIDPDKVLAWFTYHHPMYTREVPGAQRKWGTISGLNRTHFCGAYWGYGFHEDGVNSALAVCEQFGRGLA